MKIISARREFFPAETEKFSERGRKAIDNAQPVCYNRQVK